MNDFMFNLKIVIKVKFGKGHGFVKHTKEYVSYCFICFYCPLCLYSSLFKCDMKTKFYFNLFYSTCCINRFVHNIVLSLVYRINKRDASQSYYNTAMDKDEK